MNNHKSSSKTTRKSVSYKQLPTKDTEEIENEHDARENALSEGYRLLDIKAVPRDSTKFVEKEKRSRNDKTSRNRYINLLGHRRAESLGNVGQTRRHWSPPSLFVENEIKDGIDNLNAGNDGNFKETPNIKNMLGHRRASSLGKYGRYDQSHLEDGEQFSSKDISKTQQKKSRERLDKIWGGNKKRIKSTICKKLCFSSVFACHPRRMLRIKSNCRFLLLAILTLSTLMLLFTVTDFEHPNYPVIKDSFDEAKEIVETVEKNLHETNSLVRKPKVEEKLRVDKNYLIALGLPVYPDDVFIEEDDDEKKSISNSEKGHDKITTNMETTPETFRVAELWPNSDWQQAKNASEPVIISSMQSGQGKNALQFLENIRFFLPNSTIILFDMGLSSQELSLLQTYCGEDGDENISNETETEILEKFPKITKTVSKQKSHFKKRKQVEPNAYSKSDKNKQSEEILPLNAIKPKIVTTRSCQIRQFDEESLLPSHTHRLSNGAFRPLIIQTVLKDAGCILWIDIDQRIVTNDTYTFKSFALENGSRNEKHSNNKSYTNPNSQFHTITKRGGGGIVAWRRSENKPTTSLTHPNMFDRLHVWPSAKSNSEKGIDKLIKDNEIIEPYKFQHMVDMRGLLLYNTQKIRDELMIPWVKCALTPDCIEPIGAQATGCNLDKKPAFRYSGCHAYEVSALNVVLGKVFDFDESKYIIDDKYKLFIRNSDIEVRKNEKEIEENEETILVIP